MFQIVLQLHPSEPIAKSALGSMQHPCWPLPPARRLCHRPPCAKTPQTFRHAAQLKMMHDHSRFATHQPYLLQALVRTKPEHAVLELGMGWYYISYRM